MKETRLNEVVNHVVGAWNVADVGQYQNQVARTVQQYGGLEAYQQKIAEVHGARASEQLDLTARMRQLNYGTCDIEDAYTAGI